MPRFSRGFCKDLCTVPGAGESEPGRKLSAKASASPRQPSFLSLSRESSDRRVNAPTAPTQRTIVPWPSERGILLMGLPAPKRPCEPPAHSVPDGHLIALSVNRPPLTSAACSVVGIAHPSVQRPPGPVARRQRRVPQERRPGAPASSARVARTLVGRARTLQPPPGPSCRCRPDAGTALAEELARSTTEANS
jgi:hypothetical protein